LRRFILRRVAALVATLLFVSVLVFVVVRILPGDPALLIMGTEGSAEAAARHHFGISAAELNAEQAAWLAAILPSPRRYERGRTTQYLQGRVQTILARMPAAKIP